MTIITYSLKDFQGLAQRKVYSLDDHWTLPTYKLTTATDSEYVQKPNHPNVMITTQIALTADKKDCYVFEHPLLGLGRLETWTGTSILSTVLGWSEVSGGQVEGYLVWENMMFFAPSDAFAACFVSKGKCREIQRYCTQDARIRVDNSVEGDTEKKRGFKKHQDLLKLGIYLDSPYGVLEVVLKLLDLGKLAVGGLSQTVSGFGGKMLDKGKMDLYKTNMLEPYTTEDLDLFEDYLEYAKDDACQLFFLRDANSKRTEMLFAQHDLEVPEREIVTTGSLVAKLFQTFIERQIGIYDFYKFFKYQDSKGKTHEWTLEEMLKRSTVKYFAEKKETKKSVLALVQGGRAKNELPLTITQAGEVADIDLSGCYVTIQKELTYPVGLPCVYGQHESSKTTMTLGQFIQKYGSELIDRLWTVVVKGTLGHNQTLISSKVVESIEIAAKWNEATCNIPADFRLYTNEIINGVITSDVLETLKNVCSKQEYSEYMKLEVVTAAWYPKSMRCNTAEEVYEKTMEHSERTSNSVEEIVSKTGSSYVRDNRSRYWLAVSLKEFLAPYAAKRKELKDRMKECPKGSEEYGTLDAQQNAMKLVGNTNYGVLASPYFPVGNVVIANNITAIARVAVWLTGTALGCVQTVTDGGAYELNKVRTWNGHKPSMNTLSLLRNPELLARKTRSTLSTKVLGSVEPWLVVGSRKEGKDLYTTLSNGFDSIESKESGWTYFDKAALEHVREFFRDEKNPLSLLDFISYEHKDIYVKAVYHSQTNYQFTHATGEKKTKARGQKVKGKPYEGGERSNILALFEALEMTPDAVPPYRPQTISQVLKCNQANEMLESKTINLYKTNDLLAGDSISLSAFHWQTDAQYCSWERTVDGLKTRTGYGLEQFFLNPDGSCRYTEAIHTVQGKIDDGDTWLFPMTKGMSKEKLCCSPHPFYEP
jgi:hypothetical protein